MQLDLLLRGLAIGFVVAVALGPIGLLVIRRTIALGWRHGMVSGIGVATADALYGAIAAFGLTAVSELLVGIDRPLGVVGGAVLVVLAARALRTALAADPIAIAGGLGGRGGRFGVVVGAWASMVALTLTNPATILSFAALFASIGAGASGASGAVSVVVGVFAGSVAWWAMLTGAVTSLRARLTPAVVRALNVASAFVIGAFGVVALVLGLAG